MSVADIANVRALLNIGSRRHLAIKMATVPKTKMPRDLATVGWQMFLFGMIVQQILVVSIYDDI